jgi:hypothetical protein
VWSLERRGQGEEEEDERWRWRRLQGREIEESVVEERNLLQAFFFSGCTCT